MIGKPTKTVFGHLGLTQVRHVSPAPMRAPDLVGEVYQQVEREFGVLAPPVALHSPSPDVLAAVWLMVRETLLVTNSVPRVVKEAIAAAVSAANDCPFCVTMHDATLQRLAQQGAEPEAAAWATAVLTEDGAARYRPVCPASEAPELIGTVVGMQYLNRMVTAFLGEVPLPPGVPKAATRPVLRVVVDMITTASRTPTQPGAANDLLPAAPLPPDLSWSTANQGVADAFARACATVDAAGVRSVPAQVRALVSEKLVAWHGEPKGLDTTWRGDALSELSAEDRPAGTLALATALTPHRIDAAMIAEFRRHNPDDQALIDLTAWAAFAAARRTACWIPWAEHSGSTAESESA